MKSGKAVGPDDIPGEVWKCLGEAAVEFLTSLFNRVLESERMPEEWRRSVLVLIFKNKGDMQSCSNYRGIKLMSHTMKLWERVVEARLRKVVEICEQQYGFMPRKSTTDAIFALRILMEKYRDGQRELHCVFVDLEKAYDRVPREELWYCMRKSGVAEKYVRVVQDMYERSRTVVRCAVGQTEEFKVEVGLHQGSALSPFLFAIVMDQSESREQVEENLERWRFALERRGMKVSRSKTEYMCVNEREGSGTVRLQGEEVKKVQEFKYLGSTVQSNGECGKESVKLLKCADDTTLIGLISDGDKSAYRGEMDRLVSWCSTNNLELNSIKTVEMIVDFRKDPAPLPPVILCDSPVTSVESFRFLGTTITKELKLEQNTKKAQQKMYFLRQLKKFLLPVKMVVNFYTVITESILTSSITVWFAAATARDKAKLQRVFHSAEKVIGCSFPSLQELYVSRSRRRAGKIAADPSHPGNELFRSLPSGKRLRSIRTRTSRHKNSFFPTAVSLLNSAPLTPR
ncbi:hypothetical protein QTP86_008559 [Hemibagrus guttatus]|nr:hypothetical protein QTP86_008559 [Hemibagrus guttatus]